MDDIEQLANAFKESQIECLNIRNNIVSAEEIVAFEHLLVPVCTMAKRKFIFWAALRHQKKSKPRITFNKQLTKLSAAAAAGLLFLLCQVKI